MCSPCPRRKPSSASPTSASGKCPRCRWASTCRCALRTTTASPRSRCSRRGCCAAERAEEAYFRQTGGFPIMHVIVIKTDVLARHPWLAMNLYRAFDEAKQRSIARLSDITASHAPLAWLAPHAERMKALFGEDFWPYGLEKNRKTLQAFVDFALEQAVCHRNIALEELLTKQVLTSFKV